jgi:hypothetical protein
VDEERCYEDPEEGHMMMYETVEAVLHPDGRVTLPPDKLPESPVRVLITILGPDREELTSEPGDYLRQLVGYENALARGEITWQ